MEIISLLIRTRDAEYGRILQEVLKRNYRGFLISLEVAGADGEEREMDRPRGETGSGWGIDLCLCDGDDLFRETKERGEELGEKAVLLTDRPAVGARMLFKYAPAREMIGRILALCGEVLHRRIYFDVHGTLKIIGVFAAGGGRGCSTVSEAIARELVRFYRARVLLLSMDQFPQGHRRGAAGEVGARELLYRLVVDRDAAKNAQGQDLLWERACWTDAYGVARLYADTDFSVFAGASQGEWQAFLMALAASRRYTHLVVDMGERITPCYFGALGAADRLVFLTEHDGREEDFLAHLMRRGGSGVREKFLPVENHTRPAALPLLAGLYEEEVAVAGEAAAEPACDHLLAFEPRLAPGGAGDIPVAGEFAEGIATLTRLLA